jgi:hypothetical protein
MAFSGNRYWLCRVMTRHMLGEPTRVRFLRLRRANVRSQYTVGRCLSFPNECPSIAAEHGAAVGTAAGRPVPSAATAAAAEAKPLRAESAKLNEKLEFCLDGTCDVADDDANPGCCLTCL